GVPPEVAERFASLGPAYGALSVAEVARRTETDISTVAAVHFRLGSSLELDRLAERILALPRDDRWRTMARSALRDDLLSVHTELTAQVLRSTDADSDAQGRVDQWRDFEGLRLERVSNTLDDIWGEETPDLARLSVGLRVVRTMLT